MDIRKSLRAAKKNITKPFKNMRRAPAAEGDAAEGEAAAAPADGGILAQVTGAVEAGKEGEEDGRMVEWLIVMDRKRVLGLVRRVH